MTAQTEMLPAMSDEAQGGVSVRSGAWLEHKTQRKLKVLVACEYSGVVRDAFASRGHDAWSCDLLPTERPGKHAQCDVRKFLTAYVEPWDLMIAHPPCTYLSSSGMHWTTRGLRDPKLTEDALDFVRLLLGANVPHICLENPVGIISTRIRRPNQIIQPYRFGDDASKSTCLWLKGLPPLMPTKYIKPRRVCKCGSVYPNSDLSCPQCGASVSHSKPRWANQTNSGQNKLAPSENRGLDRAKTYTGIAEAMADQWTRALCSNAAGEPRGNVTPANLTFKASQKRPAALARPACYAAGDYVLASKYHDGDPQDHWCIGFYKEPYLHCGYDQRHIIVDGNGQPFRANGFRRVKKISKERGAWMLQNARIIETSGMSVWHFARCSMKPHNKDSTTPVA